ncbi:MAG TPA: hypothetical protein VGG22_07350 [Candidatus Baltobacteraceae bacterium]
MSLLSPVSIWLHELTYVAPVSSSTSAASSPIASPSSASDFAASYSPEVYAVYLNGVSSGSVLENDIYASALTRPGGAPPEIPSLPPIDGAQQVIASLRSLAGSGHILSAPVQTGAASTAVVQSSASRSSAPATTR